MAKWNMYAEYLNPQVFSAKSEINFFSEKKHTHSDFNRN